MTVHILVGDALTVLKTLDSESVQCCVTSPPYWGLRDYGVEGQLGLEKTPDEYVARMVEVFRDVRRVLRNDGTLWLNIGDSYARGFGGGTPGKKSATNVGSFKGRVGRSGNKGNGAGDLPMPSLPPGLKGKDLVGIPWMLAFALRADGWYLRSDIIWAKPNPMPESVTDRPTKAHEYVFLLSKSDRYFYDASAVAEPAAPESAARYAYSFGGAKAEHLTAEEANGPGTRTRPIGDRAFTGTRNRRTVWTINTKPFPGAHFATFPPDLVKPCIMAGSPTGGVVMDPFAGAGTTGLVAEQLGRDAILIELNPAYANLAERRIRESSPLLTEVHVA